MATQPVPRLSRAQQARVWEAMILAEMRANYFAELAGGYHGRQTALNWSTLTLSSGALASLLAQLPPRLSWLPTPLALATAALSFASLVLRNEHKATDCTNLHFQWSALMRGYEALWENMYVDDAAAQLAKLDATENDLSRLAIPYPVRERAVLKWQERAEQRRLALARTDAETH